MARLAGKTAFVTAAGAGIGRACVEAFLREGASVVASDIDEAAIADLADTHGAVRARRLDVTDAADIRRAAKEAGEVDILLNVAGWVANGTILDCSRQDWDTSLLVNATSMYETCRAFLPGMLDRQAGSIVNVASVVSSVKGAPNRFAYGTSKAAVIGLTKSIAADFVGKGVRCNAICPGTVDTPSLHERLRASGDFDAAMEAFKARQPMGRLGRPEEIASLALHLASDESGFTTGTVSMVDGGWSI
ncbi:SDR family oxidoreductase [Afifella pfennigii]|uniref:SDR family oxidoreductase n=1 Tax=Afifella pfennigii TaxID=209897 RepID=UPI00047D5C18|nr:SDR family oxidoreductase [Afifella pfennigii]